MSKKKNAEFCVACIGARQLEAGKAGTVAPSVRGCSSDYLKVVGFIP